MSSEKFDWVKSPTGRVWHWQRGGKLTVCGKVVGNRWRSDAYSEITSWRLQMCLECSDAWRKAGVA